MTFTTTLTEAGGPRLCLPDAHTARRAIRILAQFDPTGRLRHAADDGARR